MADYQKTLKQAITFSGKGLHTGVKSTITVLPSEAGTGIRFRRTDLEGCPEIPALADYVTETRRSTTLENKGVKVITVEHILSALWTMGVDNAVVEVDAPEIPILSGSAAEFVKGIADAGIEDQDAERTYYEVREPIEIAFPNDKASFVIYPSQKFSVSTHVDYNSKVVGNQYAVFSEGDDFATEIAPCRTFVFLRELEQLLNANLIKGGDIDNALIVSDQDVAQDEIERLSNIFNKKDIHFTDGYLNNTELHFHNEIARHKLLDLLGDLALVGVRIKGRIMATCPGHFANTEAAKTLRKNIKKDANRPMFVYDAAAEPVYDINKIKQLLPHRPPFLLVDRIFHIDETSVAGIKNVTMNEPFFVGHFPDEPIMPGVLIVEAMAQCGGILALHNVPDPENYSTYFMKIDNVRFKNKVVPGDTLQFELKLSEPIRRGIVMMEARAYVGGKLTTEASLMAQVIRNKA